MSSKKASQKNRSRGRPPPPPPPPRAATRRRSKSRKSRQGSRSRKSSKNSKNSKSSKGSRGNRGLKKKKNKVGLSPFGSRGDDHLEGAFSRRPVGEIDTCRFYCEQAYKRGPPYPIECGYQRLRDGKTGRFYWDDTPTRRTCLTATQQDGFELESTNTCEIWSRAFTRQQLMVMLRPYVVAHDAKELRYMTKNELCRSLSDKATEVYYELESQVSNWCQNLKGELETPDMLQVFALLQLPPPATFFNKQEACAALIKRVAEMKPPWYSRLWRYVKGKTSDVFKWVSNNPGKTVLLAAGLVAAIYFAPQIASAVKSTAQSAVEQFQGYRERTRLQTLRQQASVDLKTLDWSKVGMWADELRRLKQLPPTSITPEESAFGRLLETQLLDVTAGQLYSTNPRGRVIGYTNPIAEALVRMTTQDRPPTNYTWTDTLDPFGAIRGTYNYFATPATATATATTTPTLAPLAQSTAEAPGWRQTAYNYIAARFGA
jgi:hypothetical protein